MTDQATLTIPKESLLHGRGRTVVLLVDCLETIEGEPFAPGSEGYFLLRLATLLAGGAGGRVLLYTLLPADDQSSLSGFSITAQGVRQKLEASALAALYPPTSSSNRSRSTCSDPQPVSIYMSTVSPVVRVALRADLAADARRFLESAADGAGAPLLLLPFRRLGKDECPWLRKALRNPLPCDVAWVRPQVEGKTPSQTLGSGMRVLLPARGGPQARLSLELAQDLAASVGAQLTVLHVLQDMPERMRAAEEGPFTELLDELAATRPGVVMPRRAFTTGTDPLKSIAEAARDYDLVIMGAGGEGAADVGRFTEHVARSTAAALMAIKTREPVGPAIRAARRRARPHALDSQTLSLIVDKWFAENTFHANEFSDLGRLVDIKRQSGLTISVGLPALNEESTIGGIIRVLKQSLMEDVPLVDEMVLIDSNSVDNTREIAAELGVPVHIHQQVLPGAVEPVAGKGEALWKSLHVLKGDIIAWVDTDVVDMQPEFVYGLIGPLLREPRIKYVKGYYHRPINVGKNIQAEGGGRVTELTVRPLLNLFFPLLSGLVQPLAGEYAGRREVLERLPFFSGYGVETGLLIDMLENYGLYSIGQVNLERRIHRNRSLSDLSLTAFSIVQVILSRLEQRARITLLEEVNRSMKLIRFDRDQLSLEVRHVRDVERPPIITVPEYLERYLREQH